jgi:hypothetical protein
MYQADAADPSSSLSFAPSGIEVSKSGDLAHVLGSYSAVESMPQTQKTAEEKGTGSWEGCSRHQCFGVAFGGRNDKSVNARKSKDSELL